MSTHYLSHWNFSPFHFTPSPIAAAQMNIQGQGSSSLCTLTHALTVKRSFKDIFRAVYPILLTPLLPYYLNLHQEIFIIPPLPLPLCLATIVRCRKLFLFSSRALKSVLDVNLSVAPHNSIQWALWGEICKLSSFLLFTNGNFYWNSEWWWKTGLACSLHRQINKYRQQIERIQRTRYIKSFSTVKTNYLIMKR